MNKVHVFTKFEVQNIVSDESKDVHAARLRLYAHSSMEMSNFDIAGILAIAEAE